MSLCVALHGWCFVCWHFVYTWEVFGCEVSYESINSITHDVDIGDVVNQAKDVSREEGRQQILLIMCVMQIDFVDSNNISRDLTQNCGEN